MILPFSSPDKSIFTVFGKHGKLQTERNFGAYPEDYVDVTTTG